jgi:hypothetical protein
VVGFDVACDYGEGIALVVLVSKSGSVTRFKVCPFTNDCRWESECPIAVMVDNRSVSRVSIISFRHHTYGNGDFAENAETAMFGAVLVETLESYSTLLVLARSKGSEPKLFYGRVHVERNPF